MSDRTRCSWADTHPLLQSYHDEEWGVPVRDDRTLFEFLILEGAQAGLSWLTVLKKRDRYRQVFDNFDAEKIAAYKQSKVNQLLNDEGIIRNRLKVNAAVDNAKAFLVMRDAGEPFSDFLWSFAGGTTIQNKWKSMKDVPAVTTEAEALSKALKKKGFRFVGPTICYAFMQATGMVNDHLTTCFRHKS
jgi:DNA-3-methyladenine glycosylase I